MPLPSLGVSSLDLGRSDPFERPLFLPKDLAYSAAARGMAMPGKDAMIARAIPSKSRLIRSKPDDFSKVVSFI